jgi:hypothetical protein
MESKGEVAGASVAVISSTLAILSYLWNLGILQALFTFMAGAFITYVVQHRLQIDAEKRKEKREHAILMRDNVYGLIFKEVSKILENMKLVRTEGDAENNLQAIMSHYLYFTVKSDFKNQLSILLERYSKYRTIRWAAEKMVGKSIRKELAETYHVDNSNPDNAVWLRILVGETMLSGFSLIEAIFQRKPPKKFVETEKQKWGYGATVQVGISGRPDSNDLSAFESMYERVLGEVEKEPLFCEEKEQRKRLVQELEAFLEQVKPFVALK